MQKDISVKFLNNKYFLDFRAVFLTEHVKLYVFFINFSNQNIIQNYCKVFKI